MNEPLRWLVVYSPTCEVWILVAIAVPIVAALMSFLSPQGGPEYQAAVITTPDSPGPVTVDVDGEAVPQTLDLGVWLALADCEWNTSWHSRTTGNGFFGRHQWALGTWRATAAASGYAFPDEAPIAVQLDAARENLTRSGWGQWPGCARKLGFR